MAISAIQLKSGPSYLCGVKDMYKDKRILIVVKRRACLIVIILLPFLIFAPAFKLLVRQRKAVNNNLRFYRLLFCTFKRSKAAQNNVNMLWSAAWLLELLLRLPYQNLTARHQGYLRGNQKNQNGWSNLERGSLPFLIFMHHDITDAILIFFNPHVLPL